MYRDFEAKTEQDAINLAIEELHIERDDFDVEILDDGKRGLFRRGNVKIRVHIEGANEQEEMVSKPDFNDDFDSVGTIDYVDEEDLEPNEEEENAICDFLEGIITRMGYSSKCTVSSRRGKKLFINIESSDSSIVIGRKGKNLDAMQVLANVFAGKFSTERKIIVDSERYREHHEEQIVKSAFKAAQIVKKSGRSKLLEPMNPYERRLVHTALADVTGIDTKSEGEGLYKQVRIFARRY